MRLVRDVVGVRHFSMLRYCNITQLLSDRGLRTHHTVLSESRDIIPSYCIGTVTVVCS